jgi:hypothetical protein
MATKLNKDVQRESSVVVDDREIMVKLTADQKVSLKLKGLKSGEVSIDIEELWHQLNGTEPDSDGGSSSKSGGPVTISNEQPKIGSKNNPLISLHDLRTYNAISALDYPTLVKFEGVIKNLIDNYPEKYGKYVKNKRLK